MSTPGLCGEVEVFDVGDSISVLALSLGQGQGIQMFLDFHGHSAKLGTQRERGRHNQEKQRVCTLFQGNTFNACRTIPCLLLVAGFHGLAP